MINPLINITDNAVEKTSFASFVAANSGIKALNGTIYRVIEI